MLTDVPAGLTVRRLARGEVGLLRDWANREGWNPGPHDAAAFYDADPNGFFLGELGGEPVACISCVAYDDRFGFLGLYIVHDGYRGRGYGLAVWRAGMAHLGGRTVGLDGVVAQQENYRRSGFHYAHANVRYRVAGGGAAVPGVVPASHVPFAELAAYDRAHFPAPRPAFLRQWVALPGAHALALLRGGNLAGYGVVRPAAEGARVGPLFADDPAAADALLRSLLATVPGQPVMIDVPDATANPHAAALVERFAPAEVFRTARMYTGTPPATRLAGVYGVTSLELG